MTDQLEKITKISRAVRRPEHVNIYLSDKYWLNIHQDALLDLGLYQGMEISTGQKREIVYQAKQKRTLEKVYNYLVRRPHSKLETQLYLTQRCKLKPPDVQKLLQKLIKEEKLSDKKFAEWYINNRLAFGIHGVNKIRFELQQKGVSFKIINLELDKVAILLNTEHTTLKIKSYLEKYAGRVKHKDKYELKTKLIQRLLARGFLYEDIKKVMKIEFAKKEVFNCS